MDAHLDTLATYLKQHEGRPMQELTKLCRDAGYTDEQIEKAKQLISREQTEEVSVIYANPFQKQVQKQRFSGQTMLTTLNMVVFGTSGVGILFSLAAAAYLASRWR